MLFAVILLLAFVILAVAAVRWGQDSSDSSHSLKV
jgi:hypothetical protein